MPYRRTTAEAAAARRHQVPSHVLRAGDRAGTGSRPRAGRGGAGRRAGAARRIAERCAGRSAGRRVCCCAGAVAGQRIWACADQPGAPESCAGAGGGRRPRAELSAGRRPRRPHARSSTDRGGRLSARSRGHRVERRRVGGGAAGRARPSDAAAGRSRHPSPLPLRTQRRRCAAPRSRLARRHQPRRHGLGCRLQHPRPDLGGRHGRRRALGSRALGGALQRARRGAFDGHVHGPGIHRPPHPRPDRLRPDGGRKRRHHGRPDDGRIDACAGCCHLRRAAGRAGADRDRRNAVRGRLPGSPSRLVPGGAVGRRPRARPGLACADGTGAGRRVGRVQPSWTARSR